MTMQSQQLIKMVKYGFCVVIKLTKVSLICPMSRTLFITIIYAVEDQLLDLSKLTGWLSVVSKLFKFRLVTEAHLSRL